MKAHASLALLAVTCTLAHAPDPAQAQAHSQAQERPTLLPTRDVDIAYRAGPPETPLEQRARYDTRNQRMRLDTPTSGVWFLVDYKTRRAALVSDRDRGVLDMNAPPSIAPGAGPTGTYVRRGDDRVAGFPCTEWETSDSLNQPTLACFTSDGVMLRARRGTQTLAVATRVTYTPSDPAVFTIPATYSRVAGQAPR